MPEERINRQGWRHFVDVPEQTKSQLNMWQLGSNKETKSISQVLAQDLWTVSFTDEDIIEFYWG